MDNSDLDNHTQRTADWLRRGINPGSNGTEGQIAQGLGKLKDQLEQARRAMGQQPGGGRQSAQPDQTAALDAIERLRTQVESMAGPNGRNSGTKPGQPNGQPGNETGPPGSTDGQQAQGAPNGQAGKSSKPGAASQESRGGNALSRSGDVGGRVGDIRGGGARNADGTVWGNINTGDNQYGQARQQPSPDDPSGDYADSERTFQQELRELNQLRQMVKGDPQAAREAEELARQMQHLDPKRFPGNPEVVEQMHREVLGSIDRLELQVERSASASLASRTGKPLAIPDGYQDAVAEYYRQLSKVQ